MSDYPPGTPPPPPPPPVIGPAATPWYRQPWPLFLLGVVIAAAIAIPVLLIVLGGDEGGTAAGSSTTTTLATTTTSAVTTTTLATTTTATSPTTTAPTTTAPTTTAPTTTAATTTTAVPSGSALDYMLPAVFADNVNLAIGFTPDPTGWAVQAGGPIDAGDLGEALCHGFTTAAPSAEINYSGGTSALLRFYFVADNPGDDTVLIVSDAYGNWVCNDDYDYAGGILDPLVDITMAPEGTYDIWVATYGEGQTVPGTLYVTEVSDHHP